MFDFAWSEIALIGVVALIAIGPKDLPVAMKTVAGMVKKARRMAGEFQTHVDDMMRDADLGDVRKHIDEFRSLDLKGTIERAVDGDGSIRKGFAEDPFAGTAYGPSSASTPLADVPAADDQSTSLASGGEGAHRVLDRPTGIADVDDIVTPEPEPVLATAGAPAFIPPSVAYPPAPPPFLPPRTPRPRA